MGFWTPSHPLFCYTPITSLDQSNSLARRAVINNLSFNFHLQVTCQALAKTDTITVHHGQDIHLEEHASFNIIESDVHIRAELVNSKYDNAVGMSEQEFYSICLFLLTI